MGQLEVYNINEIYLNGIIISLFINYLAEELESTTFESYKAYIYSSNLALKIFTDIPIVVWLKKNKTSVFATLIWLGFIITWILSNTLDFINIADGMYLNKTTYTVMLLYPWEAFFLCLIFIILYFWNYKSLNTDRFIVIMIMSSVMYILCVTLLFIITHIFLFFDFTLPFTDFTHRIFMIFCIICNSLFIHYVLPRVSPWVKDNSDTMTMNAYLSYILPLFLWSNQTGNFTYVTIMVTVTVFATAPDYIKNFIYEKFIKLIAYLKNEKTLVMLVLLVIIIIIIIILASKPALAAGMGGEEEMKAAFKKAASKQPFKRPYNPDATKPLWARRTTTKPLWIKINGNTLDAIHKVGRVTQPTKITTPSLSATIKSPNTVVMLGTTVVGGSIVAVVGEPALKTAISGATHLVPRAPAIVNGTIESPTSFHPGSSF